MFYQTAAGRWRWQLVRHQAVIARGPVSAPDLGSVSAQAHVAVAAMAAAADVEPEVVEMPPAPTRPEGT